LESVNEDCRAIAYVETPKSEYGQYSVLQFVPDDPDKLLLRLKGKEYIHLHRPQYESCWYHLFRIYSQ
jgi:hypothetical protein